MEIDRTRTHTEVVIRACRREDLAGVEGILAGAPEAANWSAGGLQDALQEYAGHFFVAEDKIHLAGFALGRRVADEAEVLNLALAPEYRRQGIGKALLEKLVESFQHEGVSVFFLEVRESNTAAIRLYQAFGFVQAGCRPGYYREPREAALVYRLENRGG